MFVIRGELYAHPVFSYISPMTTIFLQMVFIFTSAVVPSQLILICQYIYLLPECEEPTWTQGLHKAYSNHECLRVSEHEPARTG